MFFVLFFRVRASDAQLATLCTACGLIAGGGGSAAKKKTTINDGRCFLCKQTGHMVKDCPLTALAGKADVLLKAANSNSPALGNGSS